MKKTFSLNRSCSLLDHKEVMEVNLVTLWVMEETLAVAEGMWAVVETLVKREAKVVEEVGEEVIMEEPTVDVMDLEVMVATMAVVLVTVEEEAMVVVDQDVETKELEMVVEKGDMIVMMKEEILVVLTTAVMGTIIILEIIVNNSNQIMEQ